ncbi:MAG: hypothetical protein NTX44_05045 [Ignavibacteriales bacterium]|nr:hypothetical protein [Ignavibacteriales bacterium]
MRKLFRITYYIGGILLFVLIAIIGYTQTRSFKTYLRDLLLHESLTAINGELQLGVIDGNLITGFRVNDVIVTEGGVELLSAQRIELKYDPFGILFKRVGVSNAIVVKPRIHISRSLNGTINIARLIKPNPTDTTSSVWTINIKRWELADAEVLFIDSLLLHQRQMGEREAPPDSVIDYARINCHALTLVFSAQIQNNTYAVKIRDLTTSIYRDEQFISAATENLSKGQHQAPVFTFKHLSGDFLLTKNEVSVRNMSIETPGTHLRFDAGMNGFDITHLSSLEELKSIPVDLSLSADDIDTRELKQFLYPSVNFLDHSLKLQLKAKGTLGALNVENLSIQMPNSMVKLHGQVRNIHHPRDLEMTAVAGDNFIVPRDLFDCLPGLHLPNLTFLGYVKYSLTYEGRPLDFKTRFSGSTAVGDINIDGKMKIDTENTAYSGMVAVHSLAMGTILNDQKLSSNLNAKMTIDGTGFNLRTMTGIAKVEMDSSLFNGLSIQHSVAVFDVADGILRSHVAASVGSGIYEISSLLTFFQKDSTRYNISGRIRSLDLADVLKDPQYGSDLSFDLTAAGAIGASTRSDTAEVHFYRSAFALQTFESAQAKAIFQVKDSVNSNLQITSTIGDLNVSGNFTPASFIAAWQNSYQLVTEGVAYRFQSLDSIRSFNRYLTTPQKFHPSHVSSVNPIDAHYRLQVKDLKPIGVFIHVPLAGMGIIEGTIAGDSIDMQLRGKADLEQFELDAATDTLTTDMASFKYFFGGIGYEKLFKKFHASVEPELTNFEINGLLFNRISGEMKADADSSDFQFSAYIDSTARVEFEGTSHVNANLMEFDIPRLKTEIGRYIAENKDTVRLILGRDGSYIKTLKMEHEDEEASLAGHFSPTGISDLNISLNKFHLSHLRQILYRGPYAKSSMQFDGMLNAKTLFRGSFKHPNIVIDMHAQDVRAIDSVQNKQKTLGKIDSYISYFEHVLGLDVKFTSRSGDTQAPPDLLLSGSLPYDFVLVREAPHPLEGSVDLTLKSTGMNLEILDPFIPVISNLSGVMTCDMQMKGPIDAPHYQGSMSIRNANFVFDPLGMPFVLNGDLIPAGDRIQLEKFTIQNSPQERLHVGTMKVSGNFTLLGLNFKQFDLLAQGDLKVMSEEKRLTGQKLYGNLFAATGPSGLVWQGDLTASTVRGEVFVKDAALTLPPEQESELARTTGVNITFKDDTSHVSLSEITKSSQAVVKKNKDAVSSALKLIHNSFLDGISYDVRIETQGPTTLRFVFNTQTSEELFADLQGRLSFNRTPEMSRLTGQVEVSNRSYYYFIKKFEATGKLLFTGNILNPELDVTATYQGMHEGLADTISTKSPSNQSQSAGISGTSKAPQVLVTLKITGTRNEPKTKISLQTKIFSDKDWTNWKDGDDEANAVSFILAGQFRNELTDQQRMGLIGTNLGFALAWGSVNGLISDALRRNTSGYIQSMDVIYVGGQFNQSTDLRLTGQVGEAVIRAGGRVLSDLTNANVSVEFPVSSIMNSEKYRNLILTFERRVEGIQNAVEERRASNGVRLFYRIIF